MSFSSTEQPAVERHDTRLASLVTELRAWLVSAKASLDEEIRAYPKPIPRCDAQFNSVYEQRSRLTILLERVSTASLPAAGQDEVRELLRDFLSSAPVVDSPGEHELRTRIRVNA